MSVVPTFLGGVGWKALTQFVSQATRIVVLVGKDTVADARPTWTIVTGSAEPASGPKISS